MTTFQLLLFIIAGVIFYLFFKQIFSGNHPKRGIDFEADMPDDKIGGISRPDKIFTKDSYSPSRIEELFLMADESMEQEDYSEAKKALDSILIIDKNSIEALGKLGFVCMKLEAYEEAKSCYAQLISLDSDDDMAYNLLANTLHHLKDEIGAEKAHKKAIEIDSEYAPHYFNYGNTLYDLKRYSDALEMYEKAYALDNSIKEAKKVIDELKAM